MAFLKTADTQIVARAVDIDNIEYAPESLKITNKDYGEELIRRMAEVLPLKTDPSNYLYIRNWAISSLEKFGYNQNRDAWLYDVLRNDYPTFIGSPVCCNHENNDPNKYYGLIPDSAFITSKAARKSWEDDYEWQSKYFSPHAKYGEKAGWVENILAINKALIELDHPGLLDRIESGDVAGTSMGCSPPGTMVTLANLTTIPIEDIKFGDEVLTHTGESKIVTETFCHPLMPEESVYEIKIVGIQDPLYLTGEHPVWCLKKERLECNYDKRSNGIKCKPERKEYSASYCKEDHNCTRYDEEYKFEFVPVEELRVGDYAAEVFPSEEINQDYLSKEFASLFGWYLAEGHLNKNYRKETKGFGTIVFSLNACEIEYSKEIRDLANILASTENFKDKISSRQAENGILYSNGSGRCVNIWNPHLANKFYELGGRYSKEKCLAEEVIYWPVEYQKELISSFIKGDGCQLTNSNYHNNTVHLATSSEKLAKQLYIILLRCGVLPYLRRLHRKPSGFRSYEADDWQIDIESNRISKLAEFAGDVEIPEVTSNFRGRRFIYKNYLVTPIKSITTIEYDGDVYNLEVEDNHSYIAGGIATHNCICQYSICSICGNKASTPTEYCIHIAHLRNYGLADSDSVFELNFDNTFFEDSIIIANTHADRNAIILNKYATKIPLYGAFKQSIRNEFIPYIKVADNLILDKKEDIKKYCECLVEQEGECKEATNIRFETDPTLTRDPYKVVEEMILEGNPYNVIFNTISNNYNTLSAEHEVRRVYNDVLKKLLSENKLPSYLRAEVVQAETDKEGTEKHVSGRYRPRGGMDLGTENLDITRALTRQKNPATIGKQYVQNQRKPTYDPTNPQNFIEMPPYDVPPRLSDTLKKAEDKIKNYQKVYEVLASLEKGGLGEATVDVMTGLMGPVNLNEPPDSYLKNLEGADKDYPESELPEDEEEHEDHDDNEKHEDNEEASFEPPIKWVEDTEEEEPLNPSVMPAQAAPMGAPAPTAPAPAAAPTSAPIGGVAGPAAGGAPPPVPPIR